MVIFIAIVAVFVTISVNGAVGKRVEPVSKAEIEVRLAQTAAAPKAEAGTESFAVLTERATEDAQSVFEAEPEEVIVEAENEPEMAESAPDAEEAESEPEYIAETESCSGTYSPNEEAEDSCFGEDQQHGDEHDLIYLGIWTVTFYCNCEICCGQWAGGPTASGTMPTAGWTIACGEDIPFGTILLINGHEYCCEDRGVPSGCVDIFVGSHEEAEALGLYYTDVYLVR